MTFTAVEYCITEDICLLFTFILLLLRLGLYKDAHGRLLLSDYFAISAWAIFFVTAMLDWACVPLGAFEPGKIDPSASEFGPEYGRATREQTISALKLFYAGSSIYYSQMYLAKASMLAFYHRLFPVCMRKLRIALWITDVLTFLGWISSLCIKLFGCLPVQNNWALGGNNCNTMLTALSNNVRWGPHVLTDLLIYILPLFLLKHLSLTTGQKLGVGATFASGLLCIGFACANQAVNYIPTMELTYIQLFGVLEQTWCCIVICLPALRTLLQREARKRISLVIRRKLDVSVQEVVRTFTGRSGTTQTANSCSDGTMYSISVPGEGPSGTKENGHKRELFIMKEIDFDIERSGSRNVSVRRMDKSEVSSTSSRV